MTITPAQVHARLAQLRQQRQEMEDQMNALIGAIQDCEFWFAQASHPDPPPPAPPAETPAPVGE